MSRSKALDTCVLGNIRVNNVSEKSPLSFSADKITGYISSKDVTNQR